MLPVKKKNIGTTSWLLLMGRIMSFPFKKTFSDNYENVLKVTCKCQNKQQMQAGENATKPYGKQTNWMCKTVS